MRRARRRLDSHRCLCAALVHGSQHIDPAEAVCIFQDTGARHALGVHWGTFQLTDESREAPREELAHELGLAGIEEARFIAAEPGQVFDFADPAP